MSLSFLSCRNITGSFGTAHIRKSYVHNNDVRFFSPGNGNSSVAFSDMNTSKPAISKRSFSASNYWYCHQPLMLFSFWTSLLEIIGKVKRTKVPLPKPSDSTAKFPPCSSTSFLESGNPRPVPSVTRNMGYHTEKSSNIFPIFSAAIPTPVSQTILQSPNLFSSHAYRFPPSGVNLTAFETDCK